jgi:hypothetical protein
MLRRARNAPAGAQQMARILLQTGEAHHQR